MSLAERDGVGAVGPLLLYPNGTVQHAGVVLGLRGTADHIMRGFPGNDDGYAGSLSCTREVSAVTGACMLDRAATSSSSSADSTSISRRTTRTSTSACASARSGRRILCTPRAVLVHRRERHARRTTTTTSTARSSSTRGATTIARGDPYYNPLLSLSGPTTDPRAAA